MIDVKCITRDGIILGYEYEGHAGFAEEGQDIVCAAVTAQLMMVFNGITMIQNIEAESSLEEEGGYFRFVIPNTEEAKKAQLLMETLHLGLRSIEIQYEDYITLKKEEV